jgi:hypothetical protein
MASYHPRITKRQAALLRAAPLFFVASVQPDLGEGPSGIGPVNVSPKGGVRLHLLSPTRVAFLDFYGSGNETARHALLGGHVTLMACSFEPNDAAIVRLYGRASVTPLEGSPLAKKLGRGIAFEQWPQRQIIELEVESTATSCGYGVPVMRLVRDRRKEDRGRIYKEAAARPRRAKTKAT